MGKSRLVYIAAGALLAASLLAAGQAGAADKPKPAAKTTAPDGMAICLQSWDAATHMSKREWKDSCRRTVREFPLVYTLPL